VPQQIGCLGGGQLGRMLALAGAPLGLEFTFLEPAQGASAGQVGRQLLGAYDDPKLLAKLAAGSDLVTFEFESVPESSAELLNRSCPVFPPPRALAVGQDRLLEKRLFHSLDIPTATYAEVSSNPELVAALDQVSVPARLKSRRLGYDGHGQVLVLESAELEPAWAELGRVSAILEQVVPFERELSALSVRARGGEVARYPLVENHHEAGILRLTLAPAPELTPELESQAAAISEALLDHLDYVGLLAVELFQVEGRLFANEIAPRVHNSGHWTMDGAKCSQFENHLRAGLGWPLGGAANSGYSAMLNILGEEPEPAEVLSLPDAHLHLYGKAPRPGRKLGHVNISGTDPVQVTLQLQALARALSVALPEPAQPDSYWPV
jgi:5-(carboxyamino)imidazole ribonucleotide synthase